MIVLVGDGPDWQEAIGTLLSLEGHRIEWVPNLDGVLPLLARGPIHAVLVTARPLAASDLLLLRRIREASRRPAIVAVTTMPTDPDLKRAFESGATAFLSWPASSDALRRAIDGEESSPRPRSRARAAGP